MQMHQLAAPELAAGDAMVACAGVVGHEVKSWAQPCSRPLLSISINETFVLPSGAVNTSLICNRGASSNVLILSGASVSFHTSYLPANTGNLPKAKDFSEPAVRVMETVPASPG